jgi:hypothetical protein
MKKTCENCPDATRCTEPCKDIEELLEQPAEDYVERPVSNIVLPGSSDDEEDEIAATIDDFIKIDIGRMFEDVSPTEIDWTQTAPQPKSLDLDPNDNKSLAQAILWAARGRPKQRQRLIAFLKCSKITEIAMRANTSKQNIQKQLQSVIRKVHQILKQSRQKMDYDPSPLHFKTKVRSE